MSPGAGLGNVPGKPLPLVILIEDSVEAMNAVEDAMEEVDRSLPSVTSKPSTKKVTSNRKALRCDVASTKVSLLRARRGANNDNNRQHLEIKWCYCTSEVAIRKSYFGPKIHGAPICKHSSAQTESRIL